MFALFWRKCPPRSLTPSLPHSVARMGAPVASPSPPLTSRWPLRPSPRLTFRPSPRLLWQPLPPAAPPAPLSGIRPGITPTRAIRRPSSPPPFLQPLLLTHRRTHTHSLTQSQSLNHSITHSLTPSLPHSLLTPSLTSYSSLPPAHPMSSGFGIHGGVSRCFEHFQDINRCVVSTHSLTHSYTH